MNKSRAAEFPRERSWFITSTLTTPPQRPRDPKNDKLEFPCITLTHIAMGVAGTDQVEAEGNKTKFEGLSIEVAVDYWPGTRGSGNAASCSMRH